MNGGSEIFGFSRSGPFWCHPWPSLGIHGHLMNPPTSLEGRASESWQPAPCNEQRATSQESRAIIADGNEQRATIAVRRPPTAACRRTAWDLHQRLTVDGRHASQKGESSDLVGHLSTICRTSIEHLSIIYRKSIEHRSNIYRTYNEHLSRITYVRTYIPIPTPLNVR